MDKNDIRIKLKNKRDKMTLKNVEEFSISICFELNKIIKQNNIDDIFIYYSFKNEVNTHHFISYLLSINKNVYLPRIENNDIVPVKYKLNDQLIKNQYGIEEPTGNANEINKKFACIIPLVAVDKSGNRIGMGKGYYDRFLKDKNCLKIGICYNYQIIKKIPSDLHDIKLDIIVSENRVINVKKNLNR